VRARLGFVYGRTLIYGTGGVAFAGAETSIDVVGPGYDAWGRKSETLVGWTVGGGLEWLIAQNWTVRAEYLYYRFDDVGGILEGEQMTSCNPACAHTTDGFGGDLDLHTVRMGVNYKF
jgi:outer membrane immunogenic protein